MFACVGVLVQLLLKAMGIARVLSRNTDLGTVGVEGRLLTVQFYGFGVQRYSCVPVMLLESFIPLLLELYSLFDRSHCD